MSLDENIVEQLKTIGVTNYLNPDSKDIKKILDAYIKSKTLDEKFISNYLAKATPSIRILFDGLKTFSEHQKEVSSKTQDNIKRALDILEKELDRDLVPEDRRSIYQLISELINGSREEAREHRELVKEIARWGIGGTIIVLGVGVLILSRGKSKDLLVQGMNIIRKIS